MLDGCRIARVQRLQRQHFIAWTGNTQRSGEQRVLRAGKKNYIVRVCRLTRAALVRLRNGLAQCPASRCGRIANIAGPQRFDRAIKHGCRHLQFRIADAEHDHVLAAQLRFARLPVDGPRRNAFALDSIHQRRIFHDILYYAIHT